MKTDLTSGISNLTKQLLEIEKQKLLNQGTDQLGSLIGDVLNQNQNTQTPPTTTETDSTNTENNTSQTSSGNPIEEGIKDVLGNVFNSSKKKKKTAKDSVQ